MGPSLVWVVYVVFVHFHVFSANACLKVENRELSRAGLASSIDDEGSFEITCDSITCLGLFGVVLLFSQTSVGPVAGQKIVNILPLRCDTGAILDCEDWSIRWAAATSSVVSSNDEGC